MIKATPKIAHDGTPLGNGTRGRKKNGKTPMDVGVCLYRVILIFCKVGGGISSVFVTRLIERHMGPCGAPDTPAIGFVRKICLAM